MPRHTEHVTIRIEGPAFDEYYPAERVSLLMLGIEQLLRDSTEALILERKVARPQLHILASFPTRGSYVQELVLVWDITQRLAESIAPILPLLPDVLGKVGDAIELLKKLMPVFDSNEQPSISVGDNSGTITINNINVKIDTLTTTGNIASLMNEFTRNLGDGINRVVVEASGAKAISVDQNDRPLLGNQRSKRAAKRLAQTAKEEIRALRLAPRSTEAVEVTMLESEEPLEATVDILSFDKIRRTGDLIVLSSKHLSQQKFGFELARTPETESAIFAMLQSRVRVLCRTVGKQRLELLRVETESH